MNTSNKNLSITLRYIIYALLAATLFVPIIVDNSMFFPFITGKAFTFRILVEAAFAVWAVLALFDPQARPKISPIFVAVTLFTLIALIADLAGMNPIRSLWSNFERSEGWITIIHLWAYFVVMVSVLQNRVNWHRFFNISFVAAGIVAVFAVIEFFSAIAAHQSGVRLDARLGNAEYLAVYMLIHAFLALYMGAVAWKNRQIQGFVYPALFILFSLILFGTQTRGTILGLIGGLCIMLVIFLFSKASNGAGIKEEKILRTISGIILTVIVLGSVGFYSIRNTSFVQDHSTLQRLASISLNNPRIQYIWPMAWEGFKARPILGWGQENFNYVFNDNYNPAMWTQEQWFDRAHNVFIDWSINAGIFGLGFYVALFVLAIMAVWKSKFNNIERAVLTSLFIAYAIHNMFVFDNLASYIMFFVMLAFMHFNRSEDMVIDPKNMKQDEPDRLAGWSNKLAAITVNPEITEWVCAPILVILLVATIYAFNVRPIEANLDLIDAMSNCQSAGQGGGPAPDVSYFTNALSVNAYVANQEIREQLYGCAQEVITAPSVDNDTKLAFYKETSIAIADQAKATPDDLRGFLFAAGFYDGIGQYSAATPFAERAYQLSPVKQSVITELATNDMGLGSTTAAVALLKKAYDEAPDYPAAQSAYIRGLYISGDFTDAITLLKQAIASDPTNTQNYLTLAVVYFYSGDKTDSISELNTIGTMNPQYQSSVTDAITAIKAGKDPFNQPPEATTSPQSAT